MTRTNPGLEQRTSILVPTRPISDWKLSECYFELGPKLVPDTPRSDTPNSETK
jgi:hypothetical protein